MIDTTEVRYIQGRGPELDGYYIVDTEALEDEFIAT